jgi:DNA invertase Pin-like site-specific DNA recombinase
MSSHESRVYGYARVSTNEQHQEGAGLPAQLRTLQQEAERRGWQLEIVTESEGASGGSLRKRPELARILDQLDRTGGVLIVTKLDRLSRSVEDFARILERSRAHGWQLVALDLGIDTSTAAGELVATMMAAVAQWERRTIADRTREGMAERKRQGVHCGRARVLPVSVVRNIVRQHESGASLAAIAADLNAASVPTAHQGKRWYPSTVRGVLTSSTAAAMLAA